MFSLEQCAKRYGGRYALAPTSLRFTPGSTTALIGPSGCGKSTLLRLLLGLLEPDEGRVLFDGVPVTTANVARVRHATGYVIQEGGLFPHLTGAENVALLARVLGRPNDWIERRLRDLAALARLAPGVLEQRPRAMSGGQRQRVALMRALMLDPPALLLDEPLGALDPVTRAELQAELRALFRTLGKTVVLVTHDMVEAARLGDTLILLRDGRVLQQGTLANLTDAPADPYVSRFLAAQRLAPVEPAA